MDLMNCKSFVIEVLKKKGACEIKNLLDSCKLTPDCPKKLNSTNEFEFTKFIRNDSDFLIRHGEACFSLFENSYKNTLLSKIAERGILSVADAEEALHKSDELIVKYIEGSNKKSAVNQFLNRHNDVFAIENGNILERNGTTAMVKQKLAVQYFLDVLSQKGSISIKALSGHWNQAPPEVKKIVKSTNPIVFKDFLVKNSFYFQLEDDQVSKRSYPVFNLCLIVDEEEESQLNTIRYFVQKLEAKKTLTLEQLVSYLNLDKNPEVIGTVGSKKLADVGDFLHLFPELFHIERNVVELHFAKDTYKSVTVRGCASDFEMKKSFAASTDKTEITVSSTDTGDKEDRFIGSLDISDAGSRKLFTNVFGKNFLPSLNDLLLSINLKSLNRIEMLWFDVKRKPFIKVLLDNPTMKYAIHELHDQPLVTVQILEEIITKLIKVSGTEYGIEGHLHTFRVNHLDNSPVGLTMFHQVHYPNIEKFEEVEKHNLRVILHEYLKTSPSNLYSYLRTISANISMHYHVLVVDFNGKIAGYNPSSITVLGKARCLSCSFKTTHEALEEAFAHSPDYIVTNCLDLFDEKIFKLLRSLSMQGIKVIASLSEGYKNFLDD